MFTAVLCVSLFATVACAADVIRETHQGSHRAALQLIPLLAWSAVQLACIAIVNT